MKKYKILLLTFLTIFGILSSEEISLNWQENDLTSNFKFNTSDPYFQENFKYSVKRDSLWHPFLSLSDFTGVFKNSFSTKKDKSQMLFYKDNYKGKDLYFQLNFFVNFNSTISDRNSKAYNSFAKGILLNGKINNKFYFYARWVDLIYFGDIDFAKESSSYFKSWSDSNDDEEFSYIDRIKGKIFYKSDFGDFAIGRGKYSIGENIKSSIILNNSVNDYGYFSHSFNWKNFRLDFLHASLISDSLRENFERNSYAEKHLAIHNITWQSDKIKFFFGEEVVYGNRGINISYLLPQFFMRITEHNLHNQDNCFIFGGFEYNLPQIKYFFNINFDELSKGKLFTDWWGNKYAAQTGISFSGDNIESTIQATAVRPWTYTHFKIVNKFSHENHSLGFLEGSNLFDFSYLLKIRRNDWLLESLNSYTIQGELGNSFSLNYDNRPKNTAKWLEGEIERRFHFKNAISYNFFNHQTLKFGYNLKFLNFKRALSTFSLNYQVIY